jgi:hypothetical protein
MSNSDLASDAASRSGRESKALREATDAATGGEDTTRLNAEVPTALYEQFREVADANERSISAQIRTTMRQAVREHRGGD